MQHTRVAALVAVVSSLSACSFDPNGADPNGANDAAIVDGRVIIDSGTVDQLMFPDARVDASPGADAAPDGSIVVTPDAAAPDAAPPADAAPLPDASMPLP